jgi:hypothetical protein
MFAAVRCYARQEPLTDTLVGHAAPIRDALMAVPGSRGCEVIGTREGLIVVVVGDDGASVVEAGRRFAAWVDRHLPGLHAVPPEVWAGEVLVHGTREDPATP